MNFSRYGIPAKEWKDYVRAHPDKGVTARLPNESASEIQSEANADRKATSDSLFEAENLDSAVNIERHIIRDTGPKSQDKLTAMVYTKVLGPEDLELDNVAGVVYFHGGGYVFGTPDTERHLCSLMASRLRVVVFHICHREAPQHQHPAGHQDGLDGFQWVLDNAEKYGVDEDNIVLVGLSSGSGIAASVALRVCNDEKTGDSSNGPPTKEEKDCNGHESSPPPPVSGSSNAKGSRPQENKRKIRGLLLAFPWLYQESSFPYDQFVAREVASRVQCADAPGMSKAVYDRLAGLLGADDPADPLLNVPLAKDSKLARLPRTALIISGMDMFRDDGLLFAEKLKTLR